MNRRWPEGVWRSVGGLVCGGLLALSDTGQCITVTSTELKIWGDWNESTTLGGETPFSTANGTFDLAATTGSLSYDLVTQPFGWSQAAAHVGAFSMALSSQSAFNTGANTLEGIIGPVQNGVNIHALSRIGFTSDSATLDVDLTCWGSWLFYGWIREESDIVINLRDLVTGATLLHLENLVDRANTSYFNLYSFTLDIDPTHEFELEMFGHINSYDGTLINVISADVAITESAEQVPDISETFPLLLGGVLALEVMRRRAQWKNGKGTPTEIDVP